MSLGRFLLSFRMQETELDGSVLYELCKHLSLGENSGSGANP